MWYFFINIHYFMISGTYFIYIFTVSLIVNEVTVVVWFKLVTMVNVLLAFDV